MKLHRDRLTWVVYGQLSVYGFFLGAFGPSQSLLRDIQQTSRTVAGLHGTAMAAGTIIAGFVIARVLHRFGREKTLWAGILALCIAAAELMFITSIFATLSAAFLSGFGGGFL
ncbi:MAG: MFS transporter, partial [Actinobacteria bacterium]|nr:MFS transporter [Actinomycetota bacterium]